MSVFLSLSSALKDSNWVDDQVRPMLSRVALGINRNTETERHSQGSPKRTGSSPWQHSSLRPYFILSGMEQKKGQQETRN